MTTTPWNDFNTALDQYTFETIPKGTLVKVVLHIQPGGYSDVSQSWENGYATKNPSSGSIYLKCMYTILEGPYAKRKVWGMIGLHSPKGSSWAEMGRSLIKAILNSAHGLRAGDESNFAKKVRYLHRLADLDGLEFVAQVDIEKDHNGEVRNTIKKAITPEHKGYAAVMGALPQPNGEINSQQSNSSQPSWMR